jgi:bacterioferritin
MLHEHSVQLLNKSVADELSAVHQYMYFHFHLDDQGFGPLAGKGEVEVAPSCAVEKITDPTAMLAKAIEMEQASERDYNLASQECGANADATSRQVFENLVGDEEGHQAAFEKQLENITRFGPSYLALQSFGARPAVAEGE